MKASEFIDKHSKGKNVFNGAEYRGASVPPFNKRMINQCMIPDKLRPKYIDIRKDYEVDRCLKVIYESQEFSEGFEYIFDEIERYFNVLALEEDLEEPIIVKVIFSTRDRSGALETLLEIC